MAYFWLKGLLIGLALSAPVGPMGLLVIRRTLGWGWLCGIVTGAGVATADCFYSSVAAFGLSAVSNVLVAHAFGFRLAGGLFLCGLGAKFFFARAGAERQDGGMGSARLATAYGSTLLLALSNPIAFVFFTGIFAGFGLAETQGNVAHAACVVAGVVSGSLLWWVTLSTAVAWLGTRLSPNVLRRVNQASGILIAGFGVWILAHLL